jgi:hypothetical protein
MAIDIKFGTPTFAAMDTHPTGLHGEVELTNGTAPVESGKLTVAMIAKSADSTQSQAAASTEIHALAAGEANHPKFGLQCDPGEWTVTFTLTSNDSGETISTEPQTVHIAGPQHHAQQFADSSKLQFNIEVTHVSAESTGLVKVDYRLTNTGSVAILPGFPIDIALAEKDGRKFAQEYKIEFGVAKGASEPRFLHVEANHTAEGDTSDLVIIGDMGGLAAKDFHFKLTWKGDKTADVAAS